MTKITKVTKVNICRELKEYINTLQYDEIEVCIMYNKEVNNFYLLFAYDLLQLPKFKGDILYKIYHHYSQEGKVTIKELFNELF